MFQQRFQCEFGWNKVKYARITITHVCFIALTLAGSLGRCLNTRPISFVFKQHPRDLANVNALKNMCDPYILSCMLISYIAKKQTSANILEYMINQVLF